MDENTLLLLGKVPPKKTDRKTYTVYLSEAVMEQLKIICKEYRPEDPPAVSAIIEEILIDFIGKALKPPNGGKGGGH